VAEDIVARLRERQRELEFWWPDPDDLPLTLVGEAADEIESLRHQLQAVWNVTNLLATRLENISSGISIALHEYDELREETDHDSQ
jgi:hypothetical protein